MRTRRRRIFVDVTAEVDAVEVLSELDDEDLQEECAARGIKTLNAAAPHREEFFELMDDMREAFHQNDRLHFEVLLLRLQAIAGVPRLTIASTKKVEATNP